MTINDKSKSIKKKPKAQEPDKGFLAQEYLKIIKKRPPILKQGHESLAALRRDEAKGVDLRDTFKNWTFLKKFEEIAMEKGF